MAMNMLRQLAGSPLPATFRTPAEIDQIKLLRAAGLVIALTPSPSDPLTLSGKADAAQVLAITDKGRQELASLSQRGETSSTPRAGASGLKTRLDALIRRQRDV